MRGGGFQASTLGAFLGRIGSLLRGSVPLRMTMRGTMGNSSGDQAESGV